MKKLGEVDWQTGWRSQSPVRHKLYRVLL